MTDPKFRLPANFAQLLGSPERPGKACMHTGCFKPYQAYHN